ncbi:MAG TPA: branched-chain amino acid ABC transporter permease [Actinomycetota bacterium]|nr:branched-chain amino acid ABC transporter permease [Actinomycetota bacterium]
MARGIKSQAEATQAATPGTRQAGGPGLIRSRYRELTRPWRDALHGAGEWFDRLPAIYQYLALASVIAFAAIIPFLLPYITSDTAYWTNILTKIGIATLLALGLNVVVGFAGLLDLGYVAFFAVGAYTFAILTGAARFNIAVFNQEPNAFELLPHWHMYFWLFFFVALIVALVAGVILGTPTLRLRGDYLAIVTLGFGEIVRITANNLDSVDNGAQGINQIPHPEIHVAALHYKFGLDYNSYFWLLLGIIVIWIFLLRRINHSRVGRAWAAIREDELAAAAMGVATLRMKLLAFAMGAAVASFGGVIYATQVAFISPDTFTLFNVDFGSVIILAMVVLGGMGGIAGPILGAATVIFLPERFRFLGDARLLVFGAVLVVVMILRPQGLLPSRRRAAELVGGEVRETTVFEAQEHGGA